MQNRSVGLDLAKPGLELGQDRLGDQVELVQQDQVRGRDLILERPFEVSPARELLGVHHDHRHVVSDPTRDRLAPEVQLDVVRQRDTRGLDHDPVRVDPLAQLFERDHELVGELTADAAPAELDERLVAAAEKRTVDPELAELVRDDRESKPLIASVLEQVAHQGGLARAQEARDEQRGNASAGRSALRHVQEDAGPG